MFRFSKMGYYMSEIVPSPDRAKFDMLDTTHNLALSRLFDLRASRSESLKQDLNPNPHGSPARTPMEAQPELPWNQVNMEASGPRPELPWKPQDLRQNGAQPEPSRNVSHLRRRKIRKTRLLPEKIQRRTPKDARNLSDALSNNGMKIFLL